jgi:hypothetical protein
MIKGEAIRLKKKTNALILRDQSKTTTKIINISIITRRLRD